MAVRKHPTKPGWWQIVISQGRGQKQRILTFQGSEAEARAFESEVRGIPAESRDCKVRDLAGRFFDWYALNRAPRSNDEMKRSFGLLLPILGDRHISLLHQNDYDRYKIFRLGVDGKGVSKRTVNIELVFFRAFLRWAKEEGGHQIGEVPKLFPKKDTQPKRSAVCTAQEVGQIIEELKGDKATITLLMSHNGLRRSEALQLKRENVDLAHRVLHITGKGNKYAAIPIVGETLYQALKTACEGKKAGDYLFINPRTQKPYKNIRKTIKSSARKAGIEKRVYNHGMRHAFGVAAIRSGANLRSVQAILRHSDIRTTEIYTTMTDDLLQLEAAKIAGIFQVSDMSDPKIEPTNKKKK